MCNKIGLVMLLSYWKMFIGGVVGYTMRTGLVARYGNYSII